MTVAERTDVLELLVAVADALIACDHELTELAENAMPLPDKVQKALDNGLACAAVLERIKKATTDEGRTKMEAMLKEELGRRTSGLDGGKIPITPVVRQGIDAALERLRSEALFDREVADALRAIL